MTSLFRITFLEIYASVGWVVAAVLTLAMWAAFPYGFGAVGEGVWISRGQGACLGIFMTGCYSIFVGARIGAAQVSRGANLYYRGSGIGEFGRWLGISLACSYPVLVSLFVGGVLLWYNHWCWAGSASEAVLVTLQFSVLLFLLFMICIMPAVGAGAKLGETAGGIFGLVFLFTGLFFPPLFSIAVKENPVLETPWVLLPHFYALDWSPAVVNMWTPAQAGTFVPPLLYGVLWCGATGLVGWMLFSSSDDSHD